MAISNLQAALKKLMAVKAVDLTKRNLEVVDFTEMSTSVSMPVGQLFAMIEKGTLICHTAQRDHKWDIDKGKHHTNKLTLSQDEFVIVCYKGKFYLVDGNHRAYAWMSAKGRQIPSHVQVVIKYTNDKDVYAKLYEEYDSPKAAKNARHRVQSAFRMAGVNADELRSPKFRDGGLVGVFRQLTKRFGYSTRDWASAAAEFKDEFLALDALGFKASGRENMNGLILGGLLVLKKEGTRSQKKVQMFISGLREAFASPGASAYLPRAIVDTHNEIVGMELVANGRKMALTGETVIPMVAEKVAAGWMQYKKDTTQKSAALPKAVKASLTASRAA